MREAAFDTIFCGIETPEPEALKAIDKAHNLMVPILDAVRTMNRHGMEVVSGIILGLDTDTKDSGARVLDFLEQSKIPMATINLLQALPRTPLWDRLQKKTGCFTRRIWAQSNWTSSRHEDVLAMWRNCMAKAYRPETLFARYEYQMRETRPHRLRRPWSRQRLSRTISPKGLTIARLLVSLRGDYRHTF
jgi:radical SAM superfamily enzyme YgiQ (UPF0313 family)